MGYPTVKADRAFSVQFESQYLSFADGQVLTGELARHLADTGSPVTVLDAGDEAPVDKPVEKMTVKELKAHAAALGVDLGDASKKAEILDVLTAAAPASGDDTEKDTAGDDETGDDDDAAGDAH